jgi:hypothetical protein
MRFCTVLNGIAKLFFLMLQMHEFPVDRMAQHSAVV